MTIAAVEVVSASSVMVSQSAVCNFLVQRRLTSSRTQTCNKSKFLIPTQKISVCFRSFFWKFWKTVRIFSLHGILVRTPSCPRQFGFLTINGYLSRPKKCLARSDLWCSKRQAGDLCPFSTWCYLRQKMKSRRLCTFCKPFSWREDDNDLLNKRIEYYYSYSLTAVGHLHNVQNKACVDILFDIISRFVGDAIQ